jgi:hypothetical protein
MKTLFKLVVAILVLNAAVRGGLAMWQYYQFKDAAQQVVLFGQRADPEEIQANIVAKATELSVLIRPDDVKVSRDGQRTIAQGSYIQPVDRDGSRSSIACSRSRSSWLTRFTYSASLTAARLVSTFIPAPRADVFSSSIPTATSLDADAAPLDAMTSASRIARSHARMVASGASVAARMASSIASRRAACSAPVDRGRR